MGGDNSLRAHHALIELLDAKNAEVREAAFTALPSLEVAVGVQAIFPAIRKGMRDPQPEVRVAAMRWLSRWGSPEAMEFREPLLLFNVPMAAGLLLVLLFAGASKLREGYRIKGRFLVFVFFLMLESPALVIPGMLTDEAAMLE